MTTERADCHSALSPGFWEQIPLEAMNRQQWEALCDGCGKCCLFKVEDASTTEIFYTNVACRLFDQQACRCTQYSRRSELVPDCIALSPEALSNPCWLPATCAYRLIAEKRDLPAWHPLISGTRDTVVSSGNSVCGRVIPEAEADDLEHHLIDWIS